MKRYLQMMAANPLLRGPLWILFAIAFYHSGQAFTIWLLEPERFAGGSDWLWMALLPILLPAFFIVNRYFGCIGGTCRLASGRSKVNCPPGH